MSKKIDNRVDFILCLFFGYLGIHKFYEEKKSLGILYLFTGGIFAIGWIIDCIQLGAKLLHTTDTVNKESTNNNQIYNDNTNIKDNTTAEQKKIRTSSFKFPFIKNDNMYLKYSYYDVEVKGTQYRNFDITKIDLHQILKFEFESTNEYDNNAIRVLYDDTFIGYVPKNNIQSMIKDYIEDDEKYVLAMVYGVNEETKNIQIAIAFYQELTDEELDKFTYIDTKLIKTNKKDESTDSPRQDQLDSLSENDELNIDYQYDTETYLVCDDYGNELGEINASNSAKLQEYELDGNELHCIVQELDYNNSGNIVCKVRIFIK